MNIPMKGSSYIEKKKKRNSFSKYFRRLWPIYNWTVYEGSWNEPYTNPGAPTHVISGSAGCYSKHNPFLNQTQLYSAFRSDDYGYSRMKIINSTHLYMEQVSDDQ
ncbi:unnamed protein product, partial [Rotaria socialis]